MNLFKATGTIGGLTLVSRILGFAREMVFARVMGASAAAEVFIWAFQLPNLLRRLLGEGAFSQGFVPLFARRMATGGHQEAERFSNEILAVFMPALLLVTSRRRLVDLAHILAVKLPPQRREGVLQRRLVDQRQERPHGVRAEKFPSALL